MCGILAFIGGGRPRAATLSNCLDKLAHRGPDGRGEWWDDHCWLGHRRLSIIDLSPTGYQPMIHSETGSVITFNGEIYNHIELRGELTGLGHQFRGRSDTEVLLAAYAQWGREFLGRLNGMWALVIWDPRRGEAIFARDRFGVKPLCYTTTSNSLAVASEPKALLGLSPSLEAVDEEALYGFLAHGELYSSNHTFYRRIQMLLPAHFAVYRPGDRNLTISRYWSIPEEANDRASAPEVNERFAWLFEDSTRLRMRADVPVGITLSGGLDSTAVLHAARKGVDDGQELKAFTAISGSGGTDERCWARRAVDLHPGVQLLEVAGAEDEWQDLLPKIVRQMDGPGYSPAVFPLWNIMKEARRLGVPVLLEGQGADELLGGVRAARGKSAIQSRRHLPKPHSIISRYGGIRFHIHLAVAGEVAC